MIFIKGIIAKPAAYKIASQKLAFLYKTLDNYTIMLFSSSNICICRCPELDYTEVTKIYIQAVFDT